MHRHCNNSRYVSWCLDWIDSAQWEDHYPGEMDVRFHRESFAGESIDIHCNQLDEHFRFDGYRDGQEIFTFYLTLPRI
jgi:acyl-ACP thioesterase